MSGFHTSKFLEKKNGRLLGEVKITVSFKLSLSFPSNWNLSLRCFNMFIAFNFFVPAPLRIDCVSLLQGFWGGKSGIMYLASRAFFLACFLPCTSCSRVKKARRFARLRSHVLRAYCNFESKQAISKTKFGRRSNDNLAIHTNARIRNPSKGVNVDRSK